MVVWSKAFPGRPECLADARRFTRFILANGAGVEAVILVAHEMAGNAIQHTASGEPGGVFVLRLTTSEDRCLVRVDDQGAPKPPVRYEADELAAYGRGLALVAELSVAWGFDGDESARSVWAEVALSEAASHGQA